MKLSDLFIGRLVYWVLAGAVFAALAALGINQAHVRHFLPFQFSVLGLAALVVVAIMVLYKPGERITRETLDIGEKKKSG